MKLLPLSKILTLKCIKLDFGWGTAPDPAGELTALPRNTSCIYEACLLLGQGRKGKGWEVPPALLISPGCRGARIVSDHLPPKTYFREFCRRTYGVRAPAKALRSRANLSIAPYSRKVFRRSMTFRTTCRFGVQSHS